MSKYIESLGVHVVKNDRNVIAPYELDLYIPSLKLAIELDGLHWHSERAGHKKKGYHLRKTERCNEKGLRLIHVFEDEWNYQKDIVKSRLKHIIKKDEERIYARNCIVTFITPFSKKEFLEQYHTLGNDASSVHLGAFYNDELVAVMTFAKRKSRDSGGYDFLRFATKAGVSIVGIASKLLRLFERQYNPKIIVSTADRRWSEGHLYKILGFECTHITTPNYYYLKKHVHKRLNRNQFKKRNLKRRLNKFDPSLTEWENMKRNGYDRIWDCGNYIFKKTY